MGNYVKKQNVKYSSININIAEFKEMLEYAQKMEFEEEPDYEYLESLLQLIKERHGFDETYEWQQKQQKSEYTIIVKKESEQIITPILSEVKTPAVSDIKESPKKKQKLQRRLKKGLSGIH